MGGGSGDQAAADAVVLASGGFQADAEWRARYLGPGWDLAKVRGTRYNTGDGIRMALEAGASPCWQLDGMPRGGWDRNAPEFGDLAVGDGFQKHSYPFGIMVNTRAKRFVDEGADFRNYTYARYGRVSSAQPHQFAWQVFDQQTTAPVPRRVPHSPGHQAHGAVRSRNSRRGHGGHRRRRHSVATVEQFNKSVGGAMSRSTPRCWMGGRRWPSDPEANWATPLEEPPFEAYQRHLRHHLHVRWRPHQIRAPASSTPRAAMPGPLRLR